MEKILLAVLLAAIVFSLYLGYAAAPGIRIFPSQAQEREFVQVPTGPQASVQPPATLPASPAAGRESISVKLLGVDERGEGQLADLLVELVPGNGRVFVSLDPRTNPALQDETQESLKIAVEVARRHASADAVKSFDLRYTLTAPTQVVGGKSAGAAIAVATIALLNGKKLRGDVVITGGIDELGRLTRVGGVLPKAIAARKAGFKRLIVPQGESHTFESREECFEDIVPGAFVRRCSVKSVPVPVSQQADIEVIEVSEVTEALEEMSV